MFIEPEVALLEPKVKTQVPLGALLESVQYSPKGSPWALLEKVKVVIKNYADDKKGLPISTAKDKVKCLDFDMDKVVFVSAPKSPVKLAEINPHNKSWLEVMDKV